MPDQGAEVQHHLRRIEGMTDATLGHIALDDPLTDVLHEVRAMLEVDTAAVLEFDPEAEQLVATAALGVEEEVHQGVRVPLGRGFAGRIVLDNEPHVLDHVDETTVVNPILWKRGIRHLLGVPMHAGGAIAGVLHVGRLEDRPFSQDDVDLLQRVADRVAFYNHVRRLELHRAAALALQRSLLPSRLPRVKGLEVAARYVPEESGVGGDWYDVFRLPSGWLGLVVGDVAGHGLDAAVVMGRLRSALRAYALESDDPAAVLENLDRLVQYFEPETTATVLYALVEPSSERIHLSSAGHPAPVLAVPGAPTRVLDVHPDPLLGVGTAPRRRTTVVDLPEGALLFCYTDGLVERREASLDERLRRLCRAVEARAPETVCAAVMGDLVGEDTPDDDITTVAVLRRPGLQGTGTGTGTSHQQTTSYSVAARPG